ncbi:unnamed protein product [Notodromas monacha]|uniref:CNH domain-containing protein n=1 Tax=Notodromas monacha TaxID=399045 RepID=A0A7R9BK21_9CRUS|nr:unnamed protein product [Notodromas monacha]CAG0915419.1 unnamed protein product [Notodromas monacha]
MNRNCFPQLKVVENNSEEQNHIESDLLVSKGDQKAKKKMINGEKASFNTPTFAQKRVRTLDMLLKDMYGEHMTDLKGMLNRRAFSDVLPDPPKLSRRKEDARQVEFVRIGQALKLETIVKGDAPTSLATTSLLKRIPWEPLCIYPDFPYDIICGDSWGDNRLFLATELGTYVVDEDEGTHRCVFDKTVQAKQLSVVEDHGILLIRADKGRDGKIFVFRLSDFERDSLEEPLNKQDIRDHRLERTKGCHLFALSRPGGAHLRMAVAMGKRLMLLQWRHTAAWTAWCPSNDNDTVEGFQVLREFNLHDSPSLLTLIDGSTTPVGILSAACGPDVTDNRVCVAYKHQFDLLNERTGEATALHTVDASRASLVAAVDVYEDEEPELLLCYNHTCHFQKLNTLLPKNNKSEFDFQWTSIPEAIVCAFPYILAFGEDSIEIRLIVNGNLVEACTYPKLKFVSSKSDIYYATTAPEFFPPRGDHIVKEDRSDTNKSSRDSSISPPISPGVVGSSTGGKPFRLYKIPMSHLTRGAPHHPNADRCPSPAPPTTPKPFPGQERGPFKNGRYLAPGGGSSPTASPFPKMGATRSCGTSPVPHALSHHASEVDEEDEDRDRFREQLRASEDYFFADSGRCGPLKEENEN